MKIIVPEAPAAAATAPQAHRARKGAGLRLGLLDNSKSNADHLFRFLIAGIRAAMPIASVVSLRKSLPSVAADRGLIEQLAKEADLVVSAMAD
jgi:hypothetical protein